jgi:acetyltransferase-like isoleucine patch superfamily enzyme
VVTGDFLAKYGLYVAKGHVPQVPFRFEPPVNLGECTIFPGCSIGAGTYINSAVVRENVLIGRYCSMGRRITIGTPVHDYTALSTSPFFNVNSNKDVQRYADAEQGILVIVGNDVWIGDNAFVKSGVTVGDGAVIGAGAVVTKDVPPYGIAYGVPAATRKFRFDGQTISRLEKIRWHEFDPEMLKLLDVGDIGSCLDTLEKWPVSFRAMRDKKYIELNNNANPA